MGKVVIAILAVFLLLGAFASGIIDGVKGWRTEDTTEPFTLVTTGAAATTANVTLTLGDLFQDKASEAYLITSNITESLPNPLPASYDTVTHKLLVSGLVPASTRTLVVNYYAETESAVMRAIGPFLNILIIGGLLFAIAFSAYEGVKRRR